MNTTSNKLVPKNLLVPFILVTSLFALWGIANDLTNPMVSAFKKVMPELSNVQASLVQFAFYFGYFCMALPAALFIRKYSYKSGIILGLVLYAIGAFLFYPAAAYQEYSFFLISLYVMTSGLAFLETTANPLVLSMGPPESATRRLNLAQAFNPMGSLFGMLVAQFFVISALRSDDYSGDEFAALDAAEQAGIRANDLDVISFPYIALGVLVLCIMCLIFFTKIPSKSEEKISLGDSFKKLFANKRYLGGVVAQTFYVGAQIMCWTYIFQYVDNLNASRPEGQFLTATYFNVAAMILFLSGRWTGTILMKKQEPAKMLFIFMTGGVICSAGAILLPGMLGLISLVLISVFMSIGFPTIYGLALRDMGDEAKIGSAGLVMAIVGGALMPVVQGAILDWGGSGLADVEVLGFIPEVKFSFILPMLCLLIVAIYAYRSFRSLNKKVG